MATRRWITWLAVTLIALAVVAWLAGWWWLSGLLVERYLRGAGGPIR